MAFPTVESMFGPQGAAPFHTISKYPTIRQHPFLFEGKLRSTDGDLSRQTELAAQSRSLLRTGLLLSRRTDKGNGGEGYIGIRSNIPIGDTRKLQFGCVLLPIVINMFLFCTKPCCPTTSTTTFNFHCSARVHAFPALLIGTVHQRHG